MARIRSPNYPAISLAEALKRVEQVHGREGQHPASREVIIKGMGYNGVHGTSLGAISAGIKYGLLEQTGKGGDYRVSDRTMAILHPHSPEEKAEAISEAAKSPTLFRELLEHFKGGLPSDDNLRAYLVRRGFSQSSLPDVIQAFRDTMELVSSGASVYPPISGRVEQTLEDIQQTATGTTRAPEQVFRDLNKAQSVTLSWIGEKGVSESSIAIKDDRVELVALLYDQVGVQKVIDRLQAVKPLLPERSPTEADEAAN